MSIEKKDKFVTYKDQNEMITKNLVSELKQGTLDKNLQEQISILCDSIRELINKEFPIRQVMEAFGPHQVYRMMYTTYAINQLAAHNMQDFNKGVTDSDDKER